MPPPLTHPFPLRLTPEEREALARVFEAFKAKTGPAIPSRTTRTDVARLALDRGLQILLQELSPLVAAGPAPESTSLPHDEAWMNGGAQLASELLPPFAWGEMDPTKDGDPILVVEGRGAFVVE